MFFDRGIMGLRPTQGDEKHLLSSHHSSWKRRPSPLSSRAKPRDLQFYGPFLEMFFRQRSAGTCGSLDQRPTQPETPLLLIKSTSTCLRQVEGEMIRQSRRGCEARTRISCHAALERTACAPFREERRMKLTEATKFHRKSGGGPTAKRQPSPEGLGNPSGSERRRRGTKPLRVIRSVPGFPAAHR
jgi:hypothetical protein